MHNEQPNNPLHGIKLEQIVTQLVARYGWDGLAGRIAVNCFKSDPSIKSSLKFLRKTPWAREKVEALYMTTFSPATGGKSQPDNPETGRPDPWKKHRR